MEKEKLFHLCANECTREALADDILINIKNKKKGYLVTPNLDFLRVSYKDRHFRTIINNATYSTIDGTPVVWLSKMFRYKPRTKITGSDFSVYMIDRIVDTQLRLFILGGKEGVAVKAQEKLEEKYGERLVVCGTCCPELGFEKNAEKTQEIVDILTEAKPDLVLVCLGAPKQEKFVYDNFDRLPVATYFCVGATVDFIAGTVKRAPKFFRKCGLEWFYRLMKEPRRLFKRYFLDFFFLIKIVFVRIFNKKKLERLRNETIA